MKKLKVLIIAYNNLGKGGIQNQIMGIVRALKDEVDFDVVVWDAVKDHYTPELEQYGVKVIRCFRKIGANILRRKADAFIRYGAIRSIIADVIREYGPYDVIHCNNAFDAAPCLEAAYKAGIPVRISHAHGTESPNLRKKLVYPAYRVLYANSRRKICRYATHMVGCSRMAADYYFGEGVGQVLHAGIDLAEFQNVRRPEKTDSTLQLLHVGGMNEKKNQLLLSDIMEELVKRGQDVRLTMIGDGGAYFSQVKARIREKGLESHVMILPADTNVPQAMAAADLLVFPSISEGFGIVLIEAQALGLRCLASDIVTREANCGGIRYLSLKKGAAFWAEMIIAEMDKGLTHQACYDVSEFSLKKMSERIHGIYKSAAL